MIQLGLAIVLVIIYAAAIHRNAVLRQANLDLQQRLRTSQTELMATRLTLDSLRMFVARRRTCNCGPYDAGCPHRKSKRRA